MKKTLIIFAIALSCLFASAQNRRICISSDDLKYKDVFINTPIKDTMNLISNEFCFTNYLVGASYSFSSMYYSYLEADSLPVKAGMYTLYTTGLSSDTIDSKGYAQPMHTDTNLQIGGVTILTDLNSIAIYNSSFYADPYPTNIGDTIQILDANLNVIYERRLGDTLYINYSKKYRGFYNIIFDSAVNVQGDYYVAYKYNPENMYHPGQDILGYFYTVPLSFYTEVGTNSYRYPEYSWINDFIHESNTKQILCYNYDVGWLPFFSYYEHYGYHVTDSAITQESWWRNSLYMYYLTISPMFLSYFTFPKTEDHSSVARTTDLVLFVIPASAIADDEWYVRDESYISPIAELEDQVKVSPNPTKGEVVISCPEPMREVALLNPMGQVLYRENYNQKRITLDLSSYPQGVYILKIQTPDGEVRKKIIKE